MINQHIGIDLGTRWIKIARIGQRPDSFFIEDVAQFKAKGNLSEKKYYKSLKKNLEEYVKEHDIKKMILHFSIAPDIKNSTTLNILELPTLDNKVIKKAVKFELEQQGIVADLGDEHFLWERLNEVNPTTENEDEVAETEILIATIRKNILYELAQMRKITWKIERIDLQHSIVSRFIKRNATIIDFGHENTRIYSFKDDTLKSFESLDVGGKYITEAIQQALESQSFEMAEELKHKATINNGFLNQNLFSAPLKVASEIASELINDLIDEIKRTIRSFELGNGISHQSIYYTGGGAELKNLIPILIDELDESVKPLYKSMTDLEVIEDKTTNELIDSEDDELMDEFADFLSKDEFSEFIDDDLNNEEFYEESNESASNTLKNQNSDSVLRSESKLNPSSLKKLMTDDHEYYQMAVITIFGKNEVNVSDLNFAIFLKYKFDLNSIFISLLVMSITLFLGVRVVHQQYDEDIIQLNSDVSKQTIEINELESESNLLRSEKDNYEGLISLVNDLQSQNKWYSRLLYTIPEKTTVGIAIQHIRIQGDVLVLNGYSTDYSNVGLFAMALEELGNVNINEIKDLEDSDIIVTDVMDTDQLSKEDKVSKIFEIEISEKGTETNSGLKDELEQDMYNENEDVIDEEMPLEEEIYTEEYPTEPELEYED